MTLMDSGRPSKMLAIHLFTHWMNQGDTEHHLEFGGVKVSDSGRFGRRWVQVLIWLLCYAVFPCDCACLKGSCAFALMPLVAADLQISHQH